MINKPFLRFDRTNHMDHMHILGSEPSIGAHTQRKYSPILKYDAQILLEQVEAKRDDVINPQNSHFHLYKNGTF